MTLSTLDRWPCFSIASPLPTNCPVVLDRSKVSSPPFAFERRLQLALSLLSSRLTPPVQGPGGGRVEDWRAGLGRCSCSLLTRPFVCECHNNHAAFPVPATSNAACGFPALRSLVCFAPRLMGPILPRRLSALAAEPDSC